MKILGLIIARKGSVGIPGKNLKKVGAYSLCEWVARAALKARHLTKLMVSTDDENVQKICADLGVEVPFTRPQELAASTTSALEVILHALDWEKSQGRDYDYVALLQPTSPFVTSQDIDNATQLAWEKAADTVITSYQAEHFQPSRMHHLGEENSVQWLDHQQTQKMPRRQDEALPYMRTGLVYILSTENLRQRNSIYGPRTFTLLVPTHRAVCIDSEFDLDFANFIASKYELHP